MKKVSILKHLLLGAILFLSIQNAHAELIIDTGQGTGDRKWLLGTFEGNEYTQFLAGEFVLTQDYRITALEGWIEPRRSGSLQYKIYSDGGEIPGSLIYSTSYAMLEETAGYGGWYGPSGLTWNLPVGIYWLSFEPSNTDFEGNMQVSILSPLSNYAYQVLTVSPWLGYDSLSIGVRIYGEPSTVPIPGAVWLLVSGLIGLVGIRRFRK